MPVNVAVIGCGNWGRNHIRIYKELESSELRVVCDAVPEMSKKAGADFQVRAITDYEEIVRDKSIDAVSICTPASTHFEIAKKCLEGGKHVLVEKPMCLSSADAERLNDISKQTGLSLLVGQTFRYDPTIAKAKEEKKKGTFGDIYYLSLSRMGLKAPRSDCGVIFNYAVHDFDIMCDFLGQKYPVEMNAITTNSLGRKFEDFALASNRFSGGVLAYTQISWLCPSKIRDFWIVGEKKSAYVDTMKFELSIYDTGVVQKYNTFGDFQLITREGGVYKPPIEKYEPLKMELSHFIDCQEKNRKPISNGDVGLRTVKMAEAALLSAKLGKTLKIDSNGDAR